MPPDMLASYFYCPRRCSQLALGVSGWVMEVAIGIAGQASDGGHQGLSNSSPAAKPSPELAKSSLQPRPWPAVSNIRIPQSPKGAPRAERRSTTSSGVLIVLALLPNGCNASLQIVAPVDRLLQKPQAYQAGLSPRVIPRPTADQRCSDVVEECCAESPPLGARNYESWRESPSPSAFGRMKASWLRTVVVCGDN